MGKLANSTTSGGKIPEGITMKLGDINFQI